MVADALHRLVADDASRDRRGGDEELQRLVGPTTKGRTKKIARNERSRTVHDDLWRLVGETARKPAALWNLPASRQTARTRTENPRWRAEDGRRVDGQGERSRVCLSVGRCQRTGRAPAVRWATPKG
ncbi:hypothetical protein JG688_00011546 [Phytophthora aleatoria]|uniref:Uncharacterized protein n=1 Tax=Phytophthora aleatoria TaxID=2496075 RepID=A0A8J5ICH1_9STRA|nr:hypothetical protein JG688_00011546 [Phytophthora aleatoria]